jgi:hypothetical protein
MQVEQTKQPVNNSTSRPSSEWPEELKGNIMTTLGEAQRKRSGQNSRRERGGSARNSSSRSGSSSNRNNDSSDAQRGLDKKKANVSRKSSVVSLALRALFFVGCAGALLNMEVASVTAPSSRNQQASRTLRGGENVRIGDANQLQSNKNNNKRSRAVAAIMADESNLDLVEQTITELESVIIAASTDIHDQTSSSKGKRTKCMRLSLVQRRRQAAVDRTSSRRKLLNGDEDDGIDGEAESDNDDDDDDVAAVVGGKQIGEQNGEIGGGKNQQEVVNEEDAEESTSRDDHQEDNNDDDNDGDNDNDEEENENDDDKSDLSNASTSDHKCKDGEVRVTEGENGFAEDDFEDTVVVDEFYKDLHSKNGFSTYRTISHMQQDFEVEKIADSLNNARDEDDIGLKHHVRDPLFGNADPEEEDLSSEDDNGSSDGHGGGVKNEKL